MFHSLAVQKVSEAKIWVTYYKRKGGSRMSLNFDSETNARAHRTTLQNIQTSNLRAPSDQSKSKISTSFKLESVWDLIKKELEVYLNMKVSVIIQLLHYFPSC